MPDRHPRARDREAISWKALETMHAPHLSVHHGLSDASTRGETGLALPTCSAHPGSTVRRYRTHGPNGPGVYPQCVPANGEHPHLLAWPGMTKTVVTGSETSVLSPSEYDVLEDASVGMTVGESAIHRSKSPETVKSQRRSVLLKLGARNMAQAVGMMGELRDDAQAV
jgi:DNA-binding CsgD family transcriptional regulator